MRFVERVTLMLLGIACVFTSIRMTSQQEQIDSLGRTALLLSNALLEAHRPKQLPLAPIEEMVTDSEQPTVR